VSVVVAVHNNAATLPDLCRRIRESLPECEIVLIDDASTDASRAVMRRLDVTSVTLAARQGQSEAIRQGLARASGRLCCVLDADLQDPPEALPLMLARLRRGDAEVVFSTRDGRRRLTSRLFRRAMRLLYPTLTSRACLCFAAGADAAADIVHRARPGDYLVAIIGVLGLRTAQVHVVRAPRPGGGSAYAGLRRTRHGITTFFSAVRLRWTAVHQPRLTS
jgi:glycosyltransferase involved in cell wall biosynthesis